MTTHYKGKLVMLGPRDEAALALLQNDLEQQGFKPTRSAAVRYALQAAARSIVATIASVATLPPPAVIATDPAVMAAAPAGEEVAG